MAQVQALIDATYDANLYNRLSDRSLRTAFLKSPAVTKRLQNIRNTLQKNRIQACVANQILDSIVDELIPAGTKSSIRGLQLNKIIASRLRKINKHRYTVAFEHTPASLKHIIQERPDWVIQDNITHRTIVGYTQIALWGGGHQLNRAAKYILNEDLHRKLRAHNAKLICLVAAKPPAISKKAQSITKTHTIIKQGFAKGRLILPKGLSRLEALFS